MAEAWNRKSLLKSWAISLTSLWKGSLRMRSSVDFWYLRISRRATVPGRYRWAFFTPPVAGADFRAALVASCFLGAFPPVDLRAVCLVRAIFRFLVFDAAILRVLGNTLPENLILFIKNLGQNPKKLFLISFASHEATFFTL